MLPKRKESLTRLRLENYVTVQKMTANEIKCCNNELLYQQAEHMLATHIIPIGTMFTALAVHEIIVELILQFIKIEHR
jgi:hypothetical protein